MRRERHSKIVFGDVHPGVNGLRAALDTIEADLTDKAEISVHGNGAGRITAIVGTVYEESERE